MEICIEILPSALAIIKYTNKFYLLMKKCGLFMWNLILFLLFQKVIK